MAMFVYQRVTLTKHSPKPSIRTLQNWPRPADLPLECLAEATRSGIFVLDLRGLAASPKTRAAWQSSPLYDVMVTTG